MLVHIIVKSSICWTQLTRNFISTHLTTFPWGSVTETFLSVFLLNKKEHSVFKDKWIHVFKLQIALISFVSSCCWIVLHPLLSWWIFAMPAAQELLTDGIWWNSGTETESSEQRHIFIIFYFYSGGIPDLALRDWSREIMLLTDLLQLLISTIWDCEMLRNIKQRKLRSEKDNRRKQRPNIWNNSDEGERIPAVSGGGDKSGVYVL